MSAMLPFVSWVAFSFLAHELAKSYFQAVLFNNDCRPAVLVLLLSAVLVTGMQLLVCGMLALFQTSKSTTENSNVSTRWLFLLAVLHAFAVLATNYSMALIPAASTHLVKVMEPMLTAAITWIVVGIVLSRQKMLGMILLVVGAIGATCNPLNVSSINAHGVQLALLSSLMYGFRNVIIKHLFGHNVTFDIFMVGRASLLGAAILLIPCTIGCVYMFGCPSLLLLNKPILLLLVGSAICHATYTYISTCVILNRLSVIGHSLPNVSKRVLVVFLLYIFSQKGYLSPYFLLICCLGLAIYVKNANGEPKINNKENNEKFVTSRSPLVVVLITGSIIATVTCIGMTTINTEINQIKSLQSWIAYKNTPQVSISSQIDRPNQTDGTMKDILTAPEAIEEASQIQMDIYRDIMGHYRKAILVGISNHNNFGDSAITVGEFMALNKLGIELIYYCNIKTCGNLSAAIQVINRTSESVIILSSGGGNFGNWKLERDLRERLAQTFKNYEILVLPQSVHFESEKVMEKNAKAMNVNPNITYLFRDHKSYDIIVNSGLYKYKRAILCPDAAVQVGVQTFSFEPTHDIVLLKRKDKEAIFKEFPAFSKNISVLVSDCMGFSRKSFNYFSKFKHARKILYSPSACI